MKKKISAIILALVFILSSVGNAAVIDSVVYDKENNTVTVTGSSKERDENFVSVYLMNNGKLYEQRLAAQNPSDVFSHIGMTYLSEKGEYKYTFGVPENIDGLNQIYVAVSEDGEASAALSKVYLYVSPVGDDSNSGTEEKTLRSLYLRPAYICMLPYEVCANSGVHPHRFFSHSQNTPMSSLSYSLFSFIL